LKERRNKKGGEEKKREIRQHEVLFLTSMKGNTHKKADRKGHDIESEAPAETEDAMAYR